MLKNISLRQLGFIQIILSGICFGALGSFGKVAYENAILPGELLSLRYSLSAILMGVVIAIINPRSLLMNRSQLITSILLGIFGYALFSSLFFMALTGLSASLTVLLLYTYPVMVAVLAQFILKEHLGKKGIMALILASIGMIALVWGELWISNPKFLFYGIGSAFFYALYIMYSRKYLKDTPAMPSSFYVQLAAGGVLSLIHFKNIERPMEIISTHPMLIIGMSVICSFLAMTLFLAGLRKINSSEASILSTTEPLFGVLIAAVVLKEKLSVMQTCGGILILVAMVLLALTNKKRERRS